MREIKFRAWATQKGHYVDVKAVSVFAIRQEVMDDPRGGDLLVLPIRDDIILEQYTGLKDDHGDEIYEGDVFNCIYHRDGCTGHKLVVVWNEFHTGFCLKSTGNCHQKSVLQKVNDMTRYPVIGNIHENPELLNMK